MSAKFKDFKFTSQELVLAMVNAANSLRLDLNRVEFVDPVPTSGTHNTQATMRAKAGGGFEGSFPIKYNRLDFNVLFSAYPIILDPEEYVTSDQLLPIINEDYGLKLQADDIVIESVSIVNDKYVLKASANSIAWFGQTEVSFRVDITAVSNFPVTELNGVFMPAYVPYEFTFIANGDNIYTTNYLGYETLYFTKLGSNYYWGEISQHMPNGGFSYIMLAKDALFKGVKCDYISLTLQDEAWPVAPKFIEVNGVRSRESFGLTYIFDQLPTPIAGLAYQISISDEKQDLSLLPTQTTRKHALFSVNDMVGTSRALSNLKDAGQTFPAGTVGLNLSTGSASHWLVGDIVGADAQFNAHDPFKWIKRIYWKDEAENSIHIVWEIKMGSFADVQFLDFPARLKYNGVISQEAVVEDFQIQAIQNWRNAVVVMQYKLTGAKPATNTEALIEFLEEFVTVAR